ncbi:MAG: helix-turn-helix transcriptional regulator [Ruminococcaceae bacterium]|nr:helix-turn-helix transcriptional regulator [Oscillospiraceae bacterium]
MKKCHSFTSFSFILYMRTNFLCYSRERLARRIGISQLTIFKWETNQTAPTVLLLSQVADVFEMTLDELIGRKIEKI